MPLDYLIGGLSKLLSSSLTVVKTHAIRYCEKVYERSGKNFFWSIKNSGEVSNNLKLRGFCATCLSTHDFSTLYTTLPHNSIKEKRQDLIEWSLFKGRNTFFTSEHQSQYKLWSCQNMHEALTYHLDNIFIDLDLVLSLQTNCWYSDGY